MTDQNNTAPAVWDPTARGGAGGWVRGGSQVGGQGAGQTGSQGGAPAPAAGGRPVHEQATQLRPAQAQPGQPGQPTGPGQPGPPAQPPAPPGDRPHQPQSQGPGQHDAPTRLAPAAPSAAPAGYGFPPHQQPPQAPPYPQSGPGPGFPAHAAPGAPAGPPPGGYQQDQYSPDQYPQGLFRQDAYPPDQYQQGAYPPGGGQPDHGGYQAIDLDDEERPPRNRTPLLVAVGLLLVLGLGGGVVWAVQNSSDGPDRKAAAPAATGAGGGQQPAPLLSGDASAPAAAPDPTTAGPSASPSSDQVKAQTEAKALDELLARAEGAKAPIGSAVAKVSSCPAKADIESAAQVFDTGAQQREQLLGELAKLDFADVAGGADAVQSLRTAWQQSAEIDRAYAAWARAVSAQGCPAGTAPTTAEKKRADELNPQATLAKKDFVAKWKPAVDTYGLTPRTWDRI
ncbi:hypothetical protein OG689_28805 [Kitasatospora sp. NBC_00240]|uniref:hypothetical protein n=1 Tax=Kitasatospora sp. NBC_00240 TaxID=2903567 RepID=UPI002254A90E|nr:hypothetical protein [Kitasatospora sp. NBC_00240]MCX5213219.1 hypothetical protein [Kitasatospora sp. NBC_00240]